MNTSLNEIYTWIEENQGTLGDKVTPIVTVTQPTGTTSSSPTYYQSDSTISYTVSGTATDNSGIAKVMVNNSVGTISGSNWSCALSLATNTTHTITISITDNAGNIETVTRYIRVEAYYQYAARISGATVQSSLSNTLTNSTVCTAIAGNSTARSTMKSKYSSNMKSYIDSNWNEGLNLLNFKCNLKCYLYHAGNLCSSVSGGWGYGRLNDSGSCTVTLDGSEYMYMTASSSSWSASNMYVNGTNLASGGGCLYTNNKITGYGTVSSKFKITCGTTTYNVGGGWAFGMVNTVKSQKPDAAMTVKTALHGSSASGSTVIDHSSSALSVTLTSSNSGYISILTSPRRQAGGGGDTYKVYVYSVWLE